MSSRMLNSMIIRSLLGICTAFWLADVGLCEEGRQFRGANQDGVVSNVNLPVEWGPKNHVLWKVDLPGTGWSQPIVWGERIFVTAAETDEQTKPDPKFTTPNIGEKANIDVNYRWKLFCLDAAN